MRRARTTGEHRIVWAKAFIYRVCQCICVGIAALFFRPRVWGARRVPRRGPVILASNHQSYFDPPLVGAFISRQAHYLGRDSLYRNRLGGAILRFFNGLEVKRGRGDIAAFKQSLRVLKDDGALVLFPEATRTADGRIRPVQAGVVSLARKSGALIVPVALEGAFDAWPRGSRFPRPTPLWLEYGKPLHPAHFDGLEPEEVSAELTGIMRNLHNRLRRRAGRRPFEYAEPAGSESLDT